jgi:hypothetical protein
MSLHVHCNLKPHGGTLHTQTESGQVLALFKAVKERLLRFKKAQASQL